MGRLLDEDDVIDAVQQHREGVLGGYEYDEGVAFVYAAAHNHIIEVVKQLPSAQPTPHWIPCSERLPKMGQPVIDNYASLNWLSFCSDGKEWAFQRPGEIISWYPLPELHQGEGEQDG